MYHKKTVFILGAGASYNYGYPLGKELIPLMIKSLEDQIPIPTVKGSKNTVFYNETDAKNGRLYDYEQIKIYILEHIELHENEKNRFVPSSNSGDKLQLFNGTEIIGQYFQNEFYYIQIGELDKFDVLKKRLLISNPTSIDAFLRNNSDLNEVAKILIIYTLLKCENRDVFNLDSQLADAWLPVLFNELTQECSNPKGILENNIDFINFNYDASFEYFFNLIFKETRTFSEKANELIDFLQTRTHHVYGCLPTTLNLNNYGHYSDLNKTRDKKTNQFYRFLQSLLHYESILTIYEERTIKDHERIRNLVKDAETINIIGFAFDKDNLNVLGFPNSKYDWIQYVNELKKIQKINYLNFEGKNTKLKSEFDHISRINAGNHFLTTHESKARSITDALLYDFKSFLFED